MSTKLRAIAQPQALEAERLAEDAPANDAVAVNGVSRIYPARNGSRSNGGRGRTGAAAPTPALADVSLRAVPGEVVAVVGPAAAARPRCWS